MLTMLTGAERNWVRVGDPNQAIFETFTTANPDLLRSFVKQPDVTAINLPHSGRSTQQIIELANFLINWTKDNHPVQQLRHALNEPLIIPTPENDPQPNPIGTPEGVFFYNKALNPKSEIILVARSAGKWIKENPEKTEQSKSNVYLKSFGLIGLGVGLLAIGAHLTVDNAVILAKEFGLSEKIIGLTVIAIGTSLPELITSIIAIRKGHTDIGVGNIIGSNIYNILMIMGVGATLGGVMISSDVYVDYAIMILFSLSLLIALKTGIINRVMGICLAVGYVVYLAVTFFK